MRPNSFRNVKGQPIAHRGLFTKDFPENSLEAIVNACQKNFWVEFDVRLSRNEDVIVFHDEDLQRMCGAPSKLEELNTQDLTVVSLKKTQCKIPTLKSVLASVPSTSALVIELKTFTEQAGFFQHDILERKVIECLQGFKGRALLKSFNPVSVEHLLRLTRDHAVGLLSCDHLKDGDFSFATHPQALALQFLEIEVAKQVDFISYGIADLTPEIAVKVTQERQQGLMTWTIRSDEFKQKALALTDNYIFEAY